MALSNIFREPRREIVETAVGFAFLALPIFADYKFAVWFNHVTTGPTKVGCPWPLGMFLGLVTLAVSLLVLFVIHDIGDNVCNAFARRGIYLRPKQRY